MNINGHLLQLSKDTISGYQIMPGELSSSIEISAESIEGSGTGSGKNCFLTKKSWRISSSFIVKSESQLDSLLSLFLNVQNATNWKFGGQFFEETTLHNNVLSGSAFISSITINAQINRYARVDISLQGTGSLTVVNTAEDRTFILDTSTLNSIYLLGY